MIIKYLITGLPRSGTKFMARLFTKAGIPCGHEMIFGFPGIAEYVEKPQAESSWLAMPKLQELREAGTYIIHLTRNPIKIINSLFIRKFFEREEINVGTFYEIFPQILFKEILDRKGIDKYIIFFLKWNQEIQKHAHMRIKLEDVNEDITLPFDLLGIPQVGIGLKAPERANQGPQKRVITEELLKTSQLYPQLIQKAKEYGYKEKELYA
jgi:hypothetical protein